MELIKIINGEYVTLEVTQETFDNSESLRKLSDFAKVTFKRDKIRITFLKVVYDSLVLAGVIKESEVD